jgi:Transposase DDE domain
MDNHPPSSRIRSSVLKNRLVLEARGSHRNYSPKDEYIDIVRSQMQTEPYQKAVSERKVWIEPLFAEGKLWHGMDRFRTRTLRKVIAEALMTATGQNVKRLRAFGRKGPGKLAQAAALRSLARPQLDPAHRRSWNHRRERRVEPTLFNTLTSLGLHVPEVGQRPRYSRTVLDANKHARFRMRGAWKVFYSIT